MQYATEYSMYRASRFLYTQIRQICLGNAKHCQYIDDSGKRYCESLCALFSIGLLLSLLLLRCAALFGKRGLLTTSVLVNLSSQRRIRSKYEIQRFFNVQHSVHLHFHYKFQQQTVVVFVVVVEF